MENPLEKDSVSLIPTLCAQAIDCANDFEWNTFSVQALFSKKFLSKEDDYFDLHPPDSCMALKNIINSKAAAFISKKTGKRQSQSPDIIFKLDFSNSSASAHPSSIFVFGHYLKKSRQYCQHLWLCNACKGKGCQKCDFKKEAYPSIEGSFRSVFAPAFCADDAFLHASGREDVDVMTCATGRPFVMEIKNPKKRTCDLKEIEEKISSSFPLEALGLKFCPAFWVEAVCTSHFDKHYRAVISCSERPLTKNDYNIICAKVPFSIRQQTPIRVMARRADLARHRHVHSIQLHGLQNGTLSVDILAEAGTYIKELIHGDNGRTVPSISSMLKTQCQCAQLDVIKIEDIYLSTLRQS